MAKVQRWNAPPTCSFCGKSKDRVAKLVAGPDGFICNECVELCRDVMTVEDETQAARSDGSTLPDAAKEWPRSGHRTGPGSHPRSRRLVLASSSVSRLRVLRDAGFDPEVVVSGADEEFVGLTPSQAVVIIAERKTLAVAARCPDSLVVGCDSMLELDGAALGKPGSGAEALEVWRRLSGRRATLHTGHCLTDTGTGRRSSRLVSSVVEFGTPSERELGVYTATPEPLTLAGAFSIEGLSGPFVQAIHGSPSNVLGLSLPALREMLNEIGTEIVDLWSRERTRTPSVSESRQQT